MARRDSIQLVVLVAAVFLAYCPVLRAGFVWDDHGVVWANPVVIAPDGLEKIWTTRAADICPLTLTVFWAEFRLWALNPLPYHLVNVGLHALNAVIFWLVLRGLNLRAAFWGAAIWALHPVQVESVAFIAEMKNTLSGLFFLLAVLLFVKMRGRELEAKGAVSLYVLSLVCALLAMAGKSSTVILPVVLGVLSWWMGGEKFEKRQVVRLAPMFLLSIAFGLVTIWTQGGELSKDVGPQWDQTWTEKLVTAGYTVWFYLGKLVWPHPLFAPYPRWAIHADEWGSYLPLIALFVLGVVIWIWRRRWPWVFVAASCFIVCLLPVLGFVTNFYSHFSFVADHFLYLGSLAPLALVGAGVEKLRIYIGAVMSQVAGAFLVACLAMASWVQAGFYQNELTFWNHTLIWDSDSPIAALNLGNYYSDVGDQKTAIEYFEKSLRSEPNAAKTHNNLGKALLLSGKLAEATEEFRSSARLNPKFGRVHTNLGVALMQQKKSDEALEQFQQGIEADPDDAEDHFNYGVALGQLDRLREAISELERTVALNPGHAEAHNLLGIAFARTGRLDDAVTEFQRALSLRPGDPNFQKNLTQATEEKNRARR